MTKKQPKTAGHLDKYAGHAGTFINDPLTGTRIPADEYQPVASPIPSPEKTPPLTEDKI